MSDFITDLSGIYTTGLETASKTASHNTNSRLGQDLEMKDFLNLMVESLKNQTIDNTADLSDMMNQMVQMSVITAINKISTLITDSTNLSYAASLVGKEVTIAQRVGTQVNHIQGVVTGTGMVDGQQAVFVGDKSYWMSDIMAVGRLPGDEESVSASARASAGTAGSRTDGDSVEGSRTDGDSRTNGDSVEEGDFRAVDEAPEGT